jgi:hypothetical protein
MWFVRALAPLGEGQVKVLLSSLAKAPFSANMSFSRILRGSTLFEQWVIN